jgi:hypothetical protein
VGSGDCVSVWMWAWAPAVQRGGWVLRIGDEDGLKGLIRRANRSLVFSRGWIRVDLVLGLGRRESMSGSFGGSTLIFLDFFGSGFE